MASKRPKDETRVTAPEPGDALLLDGVSSGVRSIDVTDFHATSGKADLVGGNSLTGLQTLTSPNAVNSTGKNPVLLSVLHGNAGPDAVTSHATPTVQISRIERITDNGSSDGSDAPALIAASTGLGSQQNVAITGYGYAQPTATADVVGVYGIAIQNSSAGHNTAYSFFGIATATIAGNGAIGFQGGIANNTGVSKAYDPATFLNGTPFLVAMDIGVNSPSTYVQAGIVLRADVGSMDAGLALLKGVRSWDIRTDTTSGTILYAGPTAHTNGVDLSAATFAGDAFKSPNYRVSGINGEVFIGTPGVAAGVISFAGATSGATLLSGPAVAGGASIVLPGGSTTLAGLAMQQTWSAQQIFPNNDLSILPATGSGILTLNYGSGNTVGTITFPQGTTNFSATGGAGQVVKQDTLGGAFTVGAPSGLTTAMFAANVIDDDATLTANSSTRVATQAATKAYAQSLFASNDALLYKGALDCSGNPNYPAADAGNVWKVSVAGKIGGASGPNVEVGDTLLCTVDGTASGNQATVGANWNIVQANLDGAVIGPASSTSGNIATFNGVGGKLIQDGGKALPTGTIVGTSDAQSLSNKTLPTPIITGLPTGTGVASANTASTLVARDGSGNFSAGTVTAALTGHASLDLALSGGTMSGAIAMGANAITGASSISVNSGGSVTLAAGNGSFDLSNGTTISRSTVDGSLVLASQSGVVNANAAALATKAPVTLGGTSGSQGLGDSSLIFNASGTFTATLIAASGVPGRWLYVKSITAQVINSASSNVVPLAGGAAGTALLASGAGKWAMLQSDGTNWITMAGN